MLIGTHALIYSTDAEADRAFLRDVLGLASIDSGGGWLIFALPPAELGVHPTEGDPRHEVYLMCDDIERTLGELQAKGAAIDGAIVEAGFGRMITIRLPSGGSLPIYEPRHATAIAREA